MRAMPTGGLRPSRATFDDLAKFLPSDDARTLSAHARAVSLSGPWALTPEALSSRGLANPGLCFKRMHRPWTWTEGGPSLGRKLGALREELLAALPTVSAQLVDGDGSTKLALLYPDGAVVEAVHMPREVAAGRVTLCLSSQVGCAMGCRFCATAQGGLQRSLSAGELVAQLMRALHLLGPRNPSLLNLVFMGMGEPLHNLTAVLEACRLFCEPMGLGMSPRRITLSTSGLVSRIDELARVAAPRPRLAVSLNAPEDALRRELMPVPGRTSLDDLFAALERYPLEPGEHLTLQYVLLAGVNDSPAQATALGSRCARLRCNVNLIAHNPVDGVPYAAPSEAALGAFAQALRDAGCRLVTLRRSRGSSSAGACGQLRGAPRA